jgi:hypothetical protein
MRVERAESGRWKDFRVGERRKCAVRLEGTEFHLKIRHVTREIGERGGKEGEDFQVRGCKGDEMMESYVFEEMDEVM